MLFRAIKLQECPSTFILNGLNQQIVEELERIVPRRLLRIDDLDNVTFSEAAAALPFVGGPTAKAGLKGAVAARGGVTLHIRSAYRTVAQQFLLVREFNFGRNRCGIAAVAQPGQSNHESGLALDISDPYSWKLFLQPRGWRHFGSGDPPHYDFIGGTDLRRDGVLAFQKLWNKHNPGDRIAEDRDWGPETEKRLLKSPVNGF